LANVTTRLSFYIVFAFKKWDLSLYGSKNKKKINLRKTLTMLAIYSKHANICLVKSYQTLKSNNRPSFDNMQAEFNSVSVIRGVVTQGRNVNTQDRCCHQKVTKYKVQYSVDGVTYQTVKDHNGNDVVRTILYKLYDFDLYWHIQLS
jgi:hypothetical protein